MADQEWHTPRDHPPEDGQAVSWLDSSGAQTDGWYRGRLWWFADWSMYVYYEPILWKPRAV